MNWEPSPLANSNYARSGVIAGVFAVFVFTVVHDMFISNIWPMFIFMAIAGALCGLCLGWSYTRLITTTSQRSWIGYNGLYVLMLILLGIVSVLVFEPAMSMAALMALNGPPDDLIRQALPTTLIFTFIAAIFICLPYRRSWGNFGAVLLTALVIVLLLGLNISALGLVAVPEGSLYLVAEFLGLMVLINVVFTATVIALEGLSRRQAKAMSSIG